MKYVALLRGINIGGRNKIDMKMLKETFENAGMIDVVTYINSGNIIFTNDDMTKADLAIALEAAIFESFGLEIKVLIRSSTEIDNIMEHLPDHWMNDKSMKSDVLFLWEDIDDEAILESLKIRPEIDTIIYRPGVILSSVDRDNVEKSAITKIVGKSMYKHMTIRNVNTFRKIYNLMQEEK
ncbi:DUF1697 domain-containing protein [Salinicoccus sp. YB14-2]|uniref:DUF1697 domain-containing protein n=1 Tax=Salinicoccus sp. YB14-2 TaxID=1572701 RepID=UPI00068E5ACB|nr:DUF1697 domain-containing protein [Salinicoccus sp. YB14-2]